MRYLSCALVCEGPSDEWFLPPLLIRAVRELGTARFALDVDVWIDPVPVDHQQPGAIADAVLPGQYDLLLYHHDGAPEAPCDDALVRLNRTWTRCRTEPVVPIAPVRETEAWILADPEAVAYVLGDAKFLEDAGFPATGKDAEKIADPKKPIEVARSAALGRRGVSRRTGPDLRAHFESFAQHISIDRLREVPSFARWWSDMTSALEGLGYTHGG